MVMSEGRKAAFWESLKEELELAAQGKEEERDGILASSDIKDAAVGYAMARAAFAEARTLRGIISNVEQAEKKIEMVNQQVADTNARLRELDSKTEQARPRRRV